MLANAPRIQHITTRLRKHSAANTQDDSIQQAYYTGLLINIVAVLDRTDDFNDINQMNEDGMDELDDLFAPGRRLRHGDTPDHSEDEQVQDYPIVVDDSETKVEEVVAD